MKRTHTYEQPILRTHRLITKGIDAAKADAIVTAAAHSLHALAKAPRIGWCTCGPCTRGEPCLGAQSHINRLRQAPPQQRSLHELLSTASHIARSFTSDRKDCA